MLEKEREILSHLQGEDNKSMNNRNYYDLFQIYFKRGDTKRALYYFEKASHFAI